MNTAPITPPPTDPQKYACSPQNLAEFNQLSFDEKLWLFIHNKPLYRLYFGMKAAPRAKSKIKGRKGQRRR